MLEYLRELQYSELIPNFWMSTEYGMFANWKEAFTQSGRIIWVEDEEGAMMLPPICTLNHGIDLGTIENSETGLFSDCMFFTGNDNLEEEFLDYEFIYNPLNFYNLSGGAWKTFRKNIRRFFRENECKYEERTPDENSVIELLESWTENVEEVEDPDAFLKFITFGTRRKFLYRGSELIGMNVWDMNYHYINYRYCICKNINYLSEALRYLFYTDRSQVGRMWVNDGGALGRESLKIFKEKLNPAITRRVYSWRKKK